MITFKQKGNFKNTEKFFNSAVSSSYMSILDKYAQQGVVALSQATPVDSGETAKLWAYEIKRGRSGVSIIWTNSNIVDGVPIAILIQYGHATRNGGYVQGRDYINPVMQPLFDKMARDVWREVNK